MASNHTTNYQLCQWQADDQVKRTDFNEDNAKIDAALNDLSDGLAAAREEKADQSALDALSQTVAQKAEQSVVSTLSAAALKIAIGEYTGNGDYGSPISVDFSTKLKNPPKIFIIQTKFGTGKDATILFRGTTRGNDFTWSGMKITWSGDTPGAMYNTKGETYMYCAIG